jgi:hypothetical protein
MRGKTETAERIGGVLDQGLPSGPGPERAEAIRRSVVALAGQRAPARAVPLRYLAAAAAGLAAVVLVVLVVGSGPSPLRFELIGVDLPAEEGVWVKTATGEPAAFVFEERSRIDLGDRTALRVVTSTDELVLVDLAEGELTAEITPGGTSRWTLQAGPYTVTVLGTSFTMAWAIEETSLEVAVRRGEVGVRGPGIPSDWIVLESGDRMRTNASSATVELGDVEEAASEETAMEGSRVAGEDEDASREAETGPGSDAGASRDGRSYADEALAPSDRADAEDAARGSVGERGAGDGVEYWRELLDRGDNRAAVLAAEREGLERLCGSASVDDLWSLANAARYARRPASAKALLKCVRSRYAGTRQGRAAAFLIAKVSLDLEGDAKTAYRWLKLYLAENPQGALAEEALGRLFEVCWNTGRNAEARSYAQDYLSRYEGGLFTERARALLERE